MSESLTAAFESSEDSRRITLHEAVAVGKIAKRGRRIEHLAHVMCVMLPVGGETQHSARNEHSCEQRGEVRLNQAPFVMPLLRPWIGKEHVNAIDACRRDASLQDLDGVLRNDPHVGQCQLFQTQQQVADTRRMNFDADAIHLRLLARILEQRLACTESDFDHARRAPAEYCIEVERAGVVGDTVDREQFIQPALQSIFLSNKPLSTLSVQ